MCSSDLGYGQPVRVLFDRFAALCLRPDAMAALYAHFAPELAEGRKAVKKDAHRLTCRISARLETADYEALQRLIEAEGYATTQDWLTATVRRYIAEAGETE